MHKEIPELLKDQYWEDVVPPDLPHTVASESYKENPFEGSTSNVIVSEKGAAVAPTSSDPLHPSQSSASLLKKSNSSKRLPPIAEPEADHLLGAEDAIENVDTINFDALTEEERPSIGDVFGIDIKEKVKEGGEANIELDEVVVADTKKDEGKE